MKQTIVECWDQEGDARLTPSCVLNRLKQMGNIDMTEKDIFNEVLADAQIFCGDVEEGEADGETPSVYMVPTNNAGLLQKC